MEKSVNYPNFKKINSGYGVVYLNDPNINLLPELKQWCIKNNFRIVESGIYKEAIKIKGRNVNFDEHLSTLELFSI